MEQLYQNLLAPSTPGLARPRWGSRLAGCAAAAITTIFGTALAPSVRLGDLLSELPAVAGLISVVLLGGVAAIGGSRLWRYASRSIRRESLATAELRTLVEGLPLPITVTGVTDGRVLFANARARRAFQLAETDSAAAPIFRNESDQRRVAELLAQDGAVENYLAAIQGDIDAPRWALVSARRIHVAGAPAIATSFVDVTDSRATEEALLNSEVRYALISRAANDGIWDWDLSSGHIYYSARWREIAEVPSSARMNTLEDWLAIVHPEDRATLRYAVDEHIAGESKQLDIEYRLRQSDSRARWMHCRGIALRSKDGVPIRMAGSQADVTLRKTYERNLRNAAYEDRLTGVGNRAYFSNLIDSKNDAVSVANDAVLILNIDQFKRVNDNLGSAAGDALLIAMARRLMTRLLPTDRLSRLGADEFAVYVEEAGDPATIQKRCQAMLDELSEPFLLGDAQVSLGISAGLASGALGAPHSGADLAQHARLAMDRSKQLGGDQHTLFDDSLLHETKLRQRLSRDLVTAGRLGQISLDYQPLVSLVSQQLGEVVGFEALMRWRHPEFGAIEPSRFVPLAEDAGLIGSLGILAIEYAAEAMGRWIDAGLAPPKLSIAVNLSVRQISDSLGVRRLFDLLDRLHLPRGSLKLEITESVLMSDPDEMVKVLNELRDRGIGLSLDDFGTGYSSLSYLHRFPLDVLKVDRSFTAQMLRSPEALRLVRSIIDLSHDLGLTVVAEGVESADEVDCLREMRCDFAQGYYFSRPLPEAQAERVLIEGVRLMHASVAA
jgi:diguanylate cyclase (GGDEF)-like protein